MPWRIPCARCPRCGAEVRGSDLDTVPVAWALADEDAATVWPRGRADLPAGVTACADCRHEPRGLYEDYGRWDRELRAYAGN